MKAFSKIFCRVFFTVDKVCCYRCVETDKDLLVGVLCYKEILKLCVGLLFCYKNHLPRVDACEGVFITSLVPRCYPWLFLHIKNRG